MEQNEKRFESDIETYLLSDSGGYKKGLPSDFDRINALNTKDLFSFIETSQFKEWENYKNAFPNDYKNRFLKRFNEEVSLRGIIDVLRNGIVDRGFKFKLIYFKPETSLNEIDSINYSKNIFNETRQLKYSTKNENSIDIVLLINGIPLVALELKNQITGQTSENAKNQFMYDRDPKELIFKFNTRIVVYFAVDHYEVNMTTKLNGSKTKYLPFNQGSNGAGLVGGAGNPANPNGYTTDYLWKKVLNRDSLLEIIQKYIHLETKEETTSKNGKLIKIVKKNLIFPRYHQLDVVRKLIKDVKCNGSGKNYLIQHSAGSGKSNSIAWLAHRLSGLHDENNKIIFNSIIVVTDRTVLDQQLQQTIYQFEHQKGVVVKIDKDKTSKDLKDAINDGKRIIITTLQKFPVIYEEIDSVSGKKFAIIVDEAHSSQTGSSAKKLKIALSDKEEALAEYARIEQEEENSKLDFEDELVKELISHGKHKNLSFFAFTATPKAKTLELFGTKQSDGKFLPFHIYSMRQAIEEKFILDVLLNYMTYETIYKIAKNTPENPEVPESYAIKLIKRFETLSDINISQKSAIIVEQYRNTTKNKINGKAKAMLVTASRLHAVRYFFEIKRYIKEKGYNDLDVLVAFSGEVPDNGEKYTESSLNKTKDNKKIYESQTKDYFHSEEFNILVVAEKYQTGFDEPLLHTMFVDKKLDGIKAVQTLSRLNRICDGKDDTFVLDFVNKAEDIQNAFKPFYDSTQLEQEVNPNLIYDKLSNLRSYKLWYDDDVKKFCSIYFKKEQNENDFGKLTSIVKDTIDLYNNLSEDDKNNFKSDVKSFNRFYSYITQVTRMYDKDLHENYCYLRYVESLLPKNKISKLNLDNKIKMTFYSLKETFNGSVSLANTKESSETLPPQSLVSTIYIEPEKRLLNEVINKLNEKYSGLISETDNLIIENLMNKILKADNISLLAKENTEQMFINTVLPKIFKEEAMNCYISSTESYKKVFENKEFYNAILDAIAPTIYRLLKDEGKEK